MKKLYESIFNMYRNRELLSDIDRNEVTNSNYNSLTVFSLVGAGCIFAMYITSLFQPVISRHRLVYLIWSIASLLIFVATQIIYRKNPKAIIYLVYVGFIVYLSYGIVLGTYTDPGMQSSTFMVMMIFVPLLFVDHPWRTSCTIVFFDVLFLLICRQVKVDAVLAADTTDGIVFGVLAVIANYYMTSIKYRRYELERELQKMGISDQLTGLYNRNCYEQQLHAYNQQPRKSVGVVYLDVNGLHELNNTLGHKAGDDMLIYVANVIKKHFGKEDTYRIGGDEFVAFVVNKELSAIENILVALVGEIEEKGYHVACGLEYSEDSNADMNAIIVSAEKKMYANKAAFYSREGNDRRRR